ncbi:MAG: sigma-70 family RNA polymerase sigma factor [Pirellulales bacterium]
MDRSLQDLRAEFLAALDRPGDRSERWVEIWQLFVGHPWYLAELHSAELRLLDRVHEPTESPGDIEHQAMLVLAKELRHAPDLHVDRALAKERFAGWLAAIIKHDCAQALRAPHPPHSRTSALPQRIEIADRLRHVEREIDLSMALQKLPDVIRTPVELYCHGRSLAEIAESLGISYWQAYRALHRGLKRLGGMLSS